MFVPRAGPYVKTPPSKEADRRPKPLEDIFASRWPSCFVLLGMSSVNHRPMLPAGWREDGTAPANRFLSPPGHDHHLVNTHFTSF